MRLTAELQQQIVQEIRKGSTVEVAARARACGSGAEAGIHACLAEGQSSLTAIGVGRLSNQQRRTP